tara:strand:- start:122 stop:370 length:249 start_codon:yes stop_codon:yes gene_type:complete
MKKSVKLYTDEVLFSYYDCMRTETDTESLHLPHSDVFYVRERLRIDHDMPVGTYPYSLYDIEVAMMQEGWGKSSIDITKEFV